MEKNAQHLKMMGKIGAGGGGGGAAAPAAGGGGLTPADVAKHNTKDPNLSLLNVADQGKVTRFPIGQCIS